ncbi:hypothetical protein MAR_029988 [Mya arenaria]|uniref:Secreted protein n=1 Tax=Mya arenaria TaxID=6604 RepID=A0ABY7DK85_MYAAR|nr:uncharacterized protein LOC128243521 [Mya arenaria]WAQ97298.1 hypothetical protein MAR_029988 [Mya arenaria]
MEVSVSVATCILMLGLAFTVSAIDPHHLVKAKIVDSSEADDDGGVFIPSARRCRRVGEHAARKRVSCAADVNFYETLSNRVHMSRIIPSEDDTELWDIAQKISQCSFEYSKYFEHACNLRTVYLNDRRRCRRLPTRQDRTRCKGSIRDRYHSG